jgi:hypothetical protein
MIRGEPNTVTARFTEHAMLLHQRFIPGLAIAAYVVGDEMSGEPPSSTP